MINIKLLLKKVYRPIRDKYLDFIHIILGIIPKEPDLIVMTSWFGERFADNTKYLYEHLFENGNVVWATKNKNIYEDLIQKNYPVINTNTLRGKWKLLRASCLVSTVQLSDYNNKYLTNTILVDLDHGIPFKQAGYAIVSNDNEYLKKHDAIVTKRIRYYLTATSYPCAIMISKIYNVPMDHIILCGKPRDDVFFDINMRIINKDFDRIVSSYKTITYMPTHRNCGKEKMNIEEHLDLEYINNLCKERGWVFVIKKHFYHKEERTDVSSFDNIVDITEMDIDSQYLLYKTDVLITDYSSVCPEFLLLDRPVILYPYDLEHYLEYDRDMFFPMDEIDFVDKPRTRSELNSSIEKVLEGIDEYKASRELFKNIFFDEEIYSEGSRDAAAQLLSKVMKDSNYKFDWEKYKQKYSDPPLQKVVDYINQVDL